MLLAGQTSLVRMMWVAPRECLGHSLTCSAKAHFS